jgi:hypothetical protein
MKTWFYANVYLGSNPPRSKLKWYSFEGDWKAFTDFILENWDSQPTHLFSHMIGISSSEDKVAKTSAISQIGSIRRDDGVLKWYEGAAEGITLGACKRVPVEMEQQAV